MSKIVSNCQHCDEPQFQALSCVAYTMFTVVKLGLFIRALLLDCNLALEENYAYALPTSCVFLMEKSVFHVNITVHKKNGFKSRF